MIVLEFLDGSTREFEEGITMEGIAASISSSLKKKTVAGFLNDELYDLNRPIEYSGKVRLLTESDAESIDVLNHSSAHLLAQALKRLYPSIRFGVGPAIKEGFYYDVNTFGEPIREEDLPRIEKEMQKIASESHEMIRRVVSRAEAAQLFEGDKYKTELLEAIPEHEDVTLYTQGEFTDLCRGGHVGNTKRIKHVKLLSIAGAYWRGDSANEQLQRIYGTAHFTKQSLEDYLQLLVERRERDHRKIAKEFDLFTVNELVGKGLPLWLPNGAAIRRELERYIVDKELELGYDHVYTPIMGSVDLYKTSGHWDHYHEDMFPVMERDGESFVLRPMNCPHHMLVYKHKPHSYKELPIRIGELGTDHRFEKSGALTGIERVRGMCMNDAHLFIRPDQIESEVMSVIELVQEVYADFDIEPDYFRLSLRDPQDKEKYFDDDAMWENAEHMLREVLTKAGVTYVEAEGEAAFYGPKLDIQIRNAMGHEVTLSTVQLDFLLPERFELDYIDADGLKKRPVVIHRAIISTMERMTSFLIEEYKGVFPLWLAPRQIVIIPVSLELHGDFAKQLEKELRREGYRVETDMREEKMGYKIREAQTGKVPYTLVLGDGEMENDTVTYRRFGSPEQTTVSRNEFKQLLSEHRSKKSRS